jgi:hypothetical protein
MSHLLRIQCIKAPYKCTAWQQQNIGLLHPREPLSTGVHPDWAMFFSQNTEGCPPLKFQPELDEVLNFHFSVSELLQAA